MVRRRLYWVWLLGYLRVAGAIVALEPLVARLVQEGRAAPGALLLYTYGLRALVVAFGVLLAWPLRWAGAGAAGPPPGASWTRGRPSRASARVAIGLSLALAIAVGLLPLGVLLALLGARAGVLPVPIAVSLGSPTVVALALVWLGALLVAVSSGRV
ncbi:MAG: hypothetical protein K6T75_02110 [Acetobacteraceae bacterium]|nr:hypothetical protein [Acetobacteraceae bacterium]